MTSIGFSQAAMAAGFLTALNTSFDVMDAATAGERFGGLAIAPVPESASYAILISGLGLLGFMTRRKKISKQDSQRLSTEAGSLGSLFLGLNGSSTLRRSAQERGHL